MTRTAYLRIDNMEVVFDIDTLDDKFAMDKVVVRDLATLFAYNLISALEVTHQIDIYISRLAV